MRFETGVGEVPVVIDREGGFRSRCTMTQPAPRYARSDVSNEDVAKSLGARVIGDIEEGSNGPTFLLAMVDDVDARLLRDGLVGAGALEVHQGAQLGRACVILVELAAGAPPRVGGACASVARGAFELLLHV